MRVIRNVLVMVGTLLAGLIIAIVVGPSLSGAPASAQAQPSASAQASASGRAAATLREQFLDKLAAELNLTRSALDSAIAGAGSTTLDAAVQQGSLTQAQADALRARLQSGDLGALWDGRGAGGSKGGASLRGVQQAMIRAAAQALGLSAEEFRAQLRSGQTLDQLAQAHNTTAQAVIDAALAAAKTQLDQAVNDGTLTRARADEIYAGLQQRGADLFEGRGRRPGRSGRPGSPSEPAAPTATPEA